MKAKRTSWRLKFAGVVGCVFLLASMTTAHAVVYFPKMYASVSHGGETAATAEVTNASSGWVQLIQRHRITGTFDVRDSKPQNNDAAYGRVRVTIEKRVCRPAPGGKCIPGLTTKEVAEKKTARTKSRLKSTIYAEWKAEDYTGVYSQYVVCIDRKFAFDKCGGITHYRSASSYNQ